MDGEGDAEVDVENSSDESEEFIYDTEDISNDSSLKKFVSLVYASLKGI
jgi:hypothetical protein